MGEKVLWLSWTRFVNKKVCHPPPSYTLLIVDRLLTFGSTKGGPIIQWSRRNSDSVSETKQTPHWHPLRRRRRCVETWSYHCQTLRSSDSRVSHTPPDITVFLSSCQTVSFDLKQPITSRYWPRWRNLVVHSSISVCDLVPYPHPRTSEQTLNQQLYFLIVYFIPQMSYSHDTWSKACQSNPKSVTMTVTHNYPEYFCHECQRLSRPSVLKKLHHSRRQQPWKTSMVDPTSKCVARRHWNLSPWQFETTWHVTVTPHDPPRKKTRLTKEKMVFPYYVTELGTRDPTEQTQEFSTIRVIPPDHWDQCLSTGGNYDFTTSFDTTWRDSRGSQINR